jgi:hypothetical protein
MTEEHKKKEHNDEAHLDKLTIKELREMAAEFPHETALHDMKKEELVAFIKEAKGIRDGAPLKKKKPLARIKFTKAELKAKIRELKKLRSQALEEHDRKKAIILRHRVSELKKKSRRVAA